MSNAVCQTPCRKEDRPAGVRRSGHVNDRKRVTDLDEARQQAGVCFGMRRCVGGWAIACSWTCWRRVGRRAVRSSAASGIKPPPTPQVIETHVCDGTCREITRASTTTPHLRNASQIPRTEGACMLTLITPFQTISVLTATAHRKPDRIGQSTISTTSNASEPPQRSIRHSSSRNGPPKLSPVATTTHTFAKDNGRACSIAGYRPWYLWTSSIWPAMMVASKRQAEDWDCRRLRRSRCTPRDRNKGEHSRVAGRGRPRPTCTWLSIHWSEDWTRQFSERYLLAQVNRRGSSLCTDR